MERMEMIEQIVAAARVQNFKDDIDDIDVLTYRKYGDYLEDRFDYIDVTTLPISVHFIGGTGHDDFSVPIGYLTTDSLKALYDCIAK